MRFRCSSCIAEFKQNICLPNRFIFASNTSRRRGWANIRGSRGWAEERAQSIFRTVFSFKYSRTLLISKCKRSKMEIEMPEWCRPWNSVANKVIYANLDIEYTKRRLSETVCTSADDTGRVLTILHSTLSNIGSTGFLQFAKTSLSIPFFKN